MGHPMVIVLLALLLGACASYQPLDYTDSSEIPPGPGLLTGEAGEWSLYRR